MKKLAVLFFAFAMSLTTTFANNDDDKRKEEVNKTLRTTIVSLLGDYQGTVSSEAEVTFMLNRENQIVIISVDSKNKEVESFVKERLNYKRIKDTASKAMKIYKLPIKIVRA